MKLSSDLFELISSMTKNEKRYFIMNSRLQGGSKIYVQLFKALEKQTAYDEKNFKINNKDEQFVKNYAFNKKNLYDLLIKNLSSYSFSGTVDGQMHALIAECRILFNKALYKKYFRAITKAKQFAHKHEKYGYLLQILDMEKIIVPKEIIHKLKSDEIMREVKAATKKFTEVFEYSRIAGMLLNNYRYYGLTRESEHTAALDKLSTKGIMSSPDKAQSTRALEAYYRVKEISSGIKADSEGSYEALLNRYRVVLNNPFPFKNYLLHYPTDIMFSLAECCINLNRTDEAAKYLNEIENMLIREKYNLEDFDIYREYLRFRIHLKKGEIQKASKLIPALENILVIYKDKLQIDTELSILYHVLICRIEENNFLKALEACNRLMAHPLLSKRADYETYSRILNLVIHYELKNFELLKYLLVRTYRYLCKHDKLFKTEQLIIDFILKLQKVKTDDDLNFNFSKLSKKLAKLKNDKYEKNAFEYFDLLKWVDTKLQQV
jgi:hypothetical protein